MSRALKPSLFLPLRSSSPAMASRLRSFSRPAAAFLLSAATRSAAAPIPRSLAPVPRPSAVVRRMGLARSLQPLHSAVSAARLTSRLGAEVARAVSQGTLCSSYPGV